MSVQTVSTNATDSLFASSVVVISSYYPPWGGYQSFSSYSPSHSWSAAGSETMDNAQSGEGDGSSYFSSQPEQAQAIQQGHCVYLKVLSPLNKKDFSMFTLRDIKPDNISTLDELKEEIFMQCGEDAQLPCTLEFKVGYFRRSQKLWINNSQDLQDAWNLIRRSERLTLWALGTAKSSKKRIKEPVDVSDEEVDSSGRAKKKKKSVSSAEERKVRQQELRDSLQVKHGPKYNAMQYTFWAEAILAQTHSSIDEPPNSPLFNAGKSRRSGSSLNEVFTGLANSISDAMKQSVVATPTTKTSTDSPGKAVALRSKYMAQLKELHTLFDLGALNAAEYEEQRIVIVDLMRQLNRK